MSKILHSESGRQLPVTSQSTSRLLSSASALALLYLVTPIAGQAQEASEVESSLPQDSGVAITLREANSDPAMQVTAEVPADHALEVRTDVRNIAPVIAVGLADSERIVERGETARFVSYTNYPALIARSEIRLFRKGSSATHTPHAVIVPNDLGTSQWAPGEDAPRDMFYVYRVYDAEGRFDETLPQELTVLDHAPEDRVAPSRPVFGLQDTAALRTITFKDVATVTVTGKATKDADIVQIGDQIVPVDEAGAFVSQQIVPLDTKTISIAIGQDGQTSYAAVRDLDAEQSEWFIVGQGDVTIGRSFSSGPAEIVSGSTLADGTYAIGRAAFYAKGPIGGNWRLTSALDTGEALLSDLFSNLDRKDPRQLLRRLNSEQYYPTYGDDSTLVEDAPTQGRFYLRAENGTSQAVIGNFVAQATGAELAQLDRGLFGALVDINSEGTTSFGERKTSILGFASDPGTVPAREEFRGTGGSLYFLKRQDVSVGSERVRVEIRDRETGLVLGTQDLHPREDYDFDPFNGRLTLLRPLSSVVDSGRTVRNGSSSGDIPVLVVRYEYTPVVGDLDGYTLGARGTQWIGDQLRLGATAQRETTEQADQTLLGADAMLRFSAGTYIKAEIAKSEGLGFDQSNSVDGGLTFLDIANPGTSHQATAWRSEASIDFAELANKQGDLGRVSAFFEHQGQGFSGAGRLTPDTTERWGVAADVPLGKTGRLVASYDDVRIEGRGANSTGELDLSNGFTLDSGKLVASLGLRHDDLNAATQFNPAEQGSRTDAAVELEFQPAGSIWQFSAFGQATLERDETRRRNNRAGGGIAAELSDHVSLKGELSGGDGGLGADFALNHRLEDGSEAYVGYTLLVDRTDTGLDPRNSLNGRDGGAFVVGSRQRFSDSLSVFGENRTSVGQDASSLVRTFGFEYEPSKTLSFTGTFESGRIDHPENGELRRTAGSISAGYVTNLVKAGTSLEVRREEGATQDQTVWLSRSNIAYALNPDWRFVGQLNLARADTDGTDIRAAEFTEAVAGFAWRPVNNERVNGLVRFQYFEDLGPIGQVTGSGQVESPKQISTIFSADFNFDLSQKLTLGTRYAYRSGKVSLGRDSDEFIGSDAHLAVLRADYNVLRKWDMLLEGRALWVEQAEDLRLGALAGIYRHLGDSVKIGVGYSWSDFSDDLTDQSYTSHGPFLNLLGRF